MDERSPADPAGRSVGELLIDSDHLARAVLAEAGAQDPAAVVRTWPEVVQAAGQVWRALQPYHQQAVADEVRRQVQSDRFERLVLTGRAFHEAVRGGGWPGPGPAQASLAAAAENLSRAAELIAGGGPPVGPLRPAQRADVQAALTRVTHALYVSTHGVDLALRAQRRDVAAITRPGRSWPAGQSRGWFDARVRQVQVFEQVCRDNLGLGWPAALAGAHQDGVPLAGALATWNLRAHRVLAATENPADLLLAAQATTMVLRLGGQILSAAGEVGDLAPATWPRLTATWSAAQDRWSALTTSWASLLPPATRRFDPQLRDGAAAVRSALTSVVFDGPVPAAPRTIAARVDLPEAARAIAEATTAAASLAQMLTQATASRDLPAPARSIWRFATHHTSTTSPVSAADYANNRPVALPAPVRAELVTAARTTAAATQAALPPLAAATGASPPDTPPPRTLPPGSTARSAPDATRTRARDTPLTPRGPTARPGPPR